MQNLWQNENALIVPANIVDKETRYALISKFKNKCYITIFTLRSDTYRIISVKRCRKIMKKITAQEFDKKFDDGEDIAEYLNFSSTIRLKVIEKLKTVTMRVDNATYEMIKLAAKGQKRSSSNFIEYATIQYLTSSQFVENDEMAEIMDDKELVENLMNGLTDFKNGDYAIV